MDCIAATGFFRYAGHSANRARLRSGGGTLARTESAPGADHYGPSRLLATALSAGAQGIGAALSTAFVAGRSARTAREMRRSSVGTRPKAGFRNLTDTAQ